MTNLKVKIISSVRWQALNTIATNVVQCVASIIIARMVMPSQYGLIAMMSIIITICQSVTNCGLSEALIRKTNRTDNDCTTSFYFNLSAAIILYAAIYVSAPVVARFYEASELTDLLRVASLSIIISSASIVPTSLLMSSLNFKRIATINITATIISSATGITLALRGWQVWALVAQSLTVASVSTILALILAEWHPTLSLSWKRLRSLLNFGSRLTLSAILNTMFTQIQSVIIGKIWHSTQLGLYSKADNLAGTTSKTVTGMIDNVAYSSLALIKDDNLLLKKSFTHLIKTAAFVIFPICLGLGGVATPLICSILPEAWTPTAHYLQILVFAYMLYPIHSINLSLIKVKGRSDLFLRLEVVKIMLITLSLAVTAPYGITAMCYGQIAVSVISLIINAHYTNKLVNIGIIPQLKMIVPSLTLSVSMYALCRIVTESIDIYVPSLFAGIACGSLFYIASAKILGLSEFKEVKQLLIK